MCALIANCNRDPSKQSRPYSARQFHPDYALPNEGKLLINRETMDTFAALMGVTPQQQQAALAQAERDREQAAKLAAKQRLRIARCA